MKRKHYLFPLMAVTAFSLSLAACDDNKTEDTAATETTVAAEAPVAAETAAPVTAVVHAEGATAYATAAGSTNGAVFLTLHNQQTAADKLVGASSPVATTVELHESAVDANGVATMTKVDAIEIPAGQQVSLKPDGYHIMLLGLNAPLTEGTPFDITLDFENAADVTLPVTVTAPVAAATEATHEGHDHGAVAPDASATDATASSTTVDESPAEPAGTATEGVTTPAETTPLDESATDAPVVDEQPAQ